MSGSIFAYLSSNNLYCGDCLLPPGVAKHACTTSFKSESTSVRLSPANIYCPSVILNGFALTGTLNVLSLELKISNLK